MQAASMRDMNAGGTIFEGMKMTKGAKFPKETRQKTSRKTLGLKAIIKSKCLTVLNATGGTSS